MRLHQKNNRCLYNPQIFLIPVTNTLFTQQSNSTTSTEENTLDFHLDMIKKIDALIQKHDPETPNNQPAPREAAHPMPRQTPVEIRSPMERRPEHIEPELPRIQEISFSNDRILPEEFKIDSSFDIRPEFKFITSLDSEESIMDIRSQHHDRIEVIDLNEFATDSIPSNLETITIADSHIQKKEQTKDNVLGAAAQEEIKKKEQVYYNTDSKNKKNNSKQNSDPDDLEKRLQALQNQIQQEQEKENSQKQHEKVEQQKKEQNEKQKKELEKEEERRRKLEEKLRKKLEKIEQKKHNIEEKIKIELEKEQEKLLQQQLKKVKSKEKKVEEEKKEPKQEVQQEVQINSVAFTKKQLREQRRLDLLAARQAIFEERLKIKKEKRLLKERKKHLELMKDEVEKYTPEMPIELDTDIKKILQITDELLGELPEEVINRFMRSDEFDLYERILNKYKIR